MKLKCIHPERNTGVFLSLLIRHRLHFSEERTLDIFLEDMVSYPADNTREIISQRKTNSV